MTSLNTTFSNAVRLHQRRQFADAEQLYRAVLESQPRHSDSIHLLGLIAHERGENECAADLIAEAIAINDTLPLYHTNLGIILRLLDRLHEANRALRSAIRLCPDHAEALFNLGNVLIDQEQFDEAVTVFRAAISAKPDHADAFSNLGNALYGQRRLTDAIAACRASIRLRPAAVKAQHNLGNALLEMDRREDASQAYRTVVCIEPGAAETWSTLGNLHCTEGQPEKAAIAARFAVLIRPILATAHFTLGNALVGRSQLNPAITAYRTAILIKPDFARAYANAGGSLRDVGRIEDAVIACQAAIHLDPTLAEAYSNLGNALCDSGRQIESIAAYGMAVRLNPMLAAAYSNQGNVLHSLGQYEGAVQVCKTVLCVHPDFPAAHTNLGASLFSIGRLQESANACLRALRVAPDFSFAHFNHGNALYDLGRLNSAIVAQMTAICVAPDFSQPYGNLGILLKDLSRQEDAIIAFERAVQIRPGHSEARSGLLFHLASQSDYSVADYLDLARQWETHCAPDVQPNQTMFAGREPLNGRRLKLGYVSGDYRKHAVSYFIEQIFTHHDRDRVEVSAYSTIAREDAVTRRLRSRVDHWVSLSGLSDQAARERIIADGIDVLIDLSGHTNHNRLGVFAGRAAPVQAHYLGFFASTGLSEMDYWVGDEILTPPESESHFRETIWRLPRTWVSYSADEDAPASYWRPASDGSVWLGSFNNLYKLTPQTIDLWAQILLKLPEGRLLLKTKQLADSANREKIVARLMAWGIREDRLELVDGATTPDWTSHMAYYDRLDVALDPIGGVSGGTTTCDALWMGVPIIGLAGDRMATRMTASMLHSIGRPEWIAQNELEYIDKAVTLARDAETRRQIRRDQRQHMATSPLCDPAGLARALEDAFHAMYLYRSGATALSPNA